MPTPPTLTDEQRRAAYEKALELRRARAVIKANITTGGLFAFRTAWPLSSVQGMKVYDLLIALDGVGPKTARRWLATAGIATKNTVRACGPRQVDRLFDLLNR